MKENWTQFGDSNTPMLYRRVKQRNSNSEILTLKREDDSWVEGHDEVSNLLVSNLKSVFHPQEKVGIEEEIDLVLRQLYIPGLSNDDAQRMDRPFSDIEIKNAMFNIHSSKSPGPDGIIAEFLHKFWDKIGNSVIKSVKHFFSSEKMLKEWNQSLLVMIPKVSTPELASQFRPIGLYNKIYKCVSKCMVNRMKSVLPVLISEYQHDFIPGRYIEDKVLLSHELIQVICKKKMSLASIKLDMSKAYDRVNWVFLLKVLKAYGFSAHWIGRIHQCISTVSYKALINGKTTEVFKPKCGLRQGDPLSPYLFLFCMDILSRMLKLGEEVKQFQGIKISRRAPSINHLFFADDALLFFKADKKGCTNIIQILTNFGRISG